jgi:hypothetical protein
MSNHGWKVSVVVAALLLGACGSSSEPAAVEFVVPFSLGPGRVTGAAVDDGMVCAAGTVTRLKMEDENGDLVTDEDGMQRWDEAMESGATLHMTLYDEFTCSDGSGSISIVVDNVVQPAALDFSGSNDGGTWEIRGGTGDYEGFSGEGKYVSDFGTGLATYSGEIGEG